MAKSQTLVEQLEYAASDEGGQYVEALKIISHGKIHYVLHFYHALPVAGLIKASGHVKIDYSDRSKLLKEFPYGPGGFFGRLDNRSLWQDTDPQCGYSDVPIKEFEKAREEGLEIRVKTK